MSEAGMSATLSQRPRMAPGGVRSTQLSALEAMERGFALFQSTFSREAWRYYLGAAPLVVCFVPFWVINGQIQISNAALLIETAVLCAAYLLRVLLVGSYMQHVREKTFGTRASKPASVMMRTAVLARLLAWKIILSAASLIILPTLAGASWFYGGSQFASIEKWSNSGETHSFRGCLSLSRQWFGQGLLLLFMLVPLWAAVWLNGTILALILPRLMHSIFGVDTLLSTRMGMWALLQSSAFWLSLFAGAWLALDPIVKCTYVIVYQHLRSRREGDDLRGLLASLPREQEKKSQMMAKARDGRMATGTLFVLATILVSVFLVVPLRAVEIPQPGTAAGIQESSADQARIEKLRTALNQESQRAIYRWHDAEHPSPPTWFDRMLTKIGASFRRAWDALWNFLHRLWPRGLNLSLGDQKGEGWHLNDLRFWLTTIAILTLATSAVLFWLRRRQGTTPVSIPMQIAPHIDLSDSSAAIERSEEEWFSLARQLEAQGELRLGLRAAYFGLLSGLAQREWLTIRRDRTNREYLNEFTRRWRRRPQATVEVRMEIPDRLRGSLRQFDSVWYGLYAVSPELVAAYRETQQEFLNHV